MSRPPETPTLTNEQKADKAKRKAKRKVENERKRKLLEDRKAQHMANLNQQGNGGYVPPVVEASRKLLEEAAAGRDLGSAKYGTQVSALKVYAPEGSREGAA